MFTENDLKLFLKFKNAMELTEKFFHDHVDSIKYPDKFEAEILDNTVVLETFEKSLECINVGRKYKSHDYSICYANWVLVPCDVAWISYSIKDLEIARTINGSIDRAMAPFADNDKVAFDFTKEPLEGIIYINGVKYRRWKPASPFLIIYDKAEFKASKPCNIWLMGGADVGSVPLHESGVYLTEGPNPFLVHIYNIYASNHVTSITVYACGKNKEHLKSKSMKIDKDSIYFTRKRYEFVFESNGNI